MGLAIVGNELRWGLGGSLSLVGLIIAVMAV
jgi:hypothetical protein